MKLLERFGRFSAVGLLSAAVDYGLFWVLQGVMPPSAANVVSMTASLAVNFLLNRRWTFQANGRFGRSAVLYLLLFGANLVVTSAAIGLLSSLIDARIAKLLVMAAASVWNFFLYRKFIFK